MVCSFDGLCRYWRIVGSYPIPYYSIVPQGDALQRGTRVSHLCCIAFYFGRRAEVLKMICTLNAPSCKVFNC